MRLMQRAIMSLEQGAKGLSGQEALLPRWNVAQIHNCLCLKDLCGTCGAIQIIQL